MLSSIAKLPLAQHPATWDSFWRDSVTPWDRGGPSLALHDLLAQRPDLVSSSQSPNTTPTNTPPLRKKALVPGCGRGHDVLLLSSWGYDVWGLDASAAAKKEALANQAQADAKGMYRPVGGLEKGDVYWVTGDFFGEEWTEGIGSDVRFDLIFDYTFLCALPPSARPKWSLRTVSLLAPSGRLVCLEFPTAKNMSADGPPWGVSPELYEALLASPGEDVSYRPDGSVRDDVPPSPTPRHGGLHRLSLIKPPRTHRDGTAEDGAVLDFVSVWSR